ncbi:hypothetical protein ACJX0J_036405, partial [Zea mays]
CLNENDNWQQMPMNKYLGTKSLTQQERKRKYNNIHVSSMMGNKLDRTPQGAFSYFYYSWWEGSFVIAILLELFGGLFLDLGKIPSIKEEAHKEINDSCHSLEVVAIEIFARLMASEIGVFGVFSLLTPIQAFETQPTGHPTTLIQGHLVMHVIGKHEHQENTGGVQFIEIELPKAQGEDYIIPVWLFSLKLSFIEIIIIRIHFKSNENKWGGGGGGGAGPQLTLLLCLHDGVGITQSSRSFNLLVFTATCDMCINLFTLLACGVVVQYIFDAFDRYLLNSHLDIWFNCTIALSCHDKDTACSFLVSHFTLYTKRKRILIL